MKDLMDFTQNFILHQNNQCKVQTFFWQGVMFVPMTTLFSEVCISN